MQDVAFYDGKIFLSGGASHNNAILTVVDQKLHTFAESFQLREPVSDKKCLNVSSLRVIESTSMWPGVCRLMGIQTALDSCMRYDLTFSWFQVGIVFDGSSMFVASSQHIVRFNNNGGYISSMKVVAYSSLCHMLTT